MKILFIGETWKGSSARSLREGLELIDSLEMDEVGEDHFLPKQKHLVLRGISKLLIGLQVHDLEAEITRRANLFKPDVVLVYKGFGVSPVLLQSLKGRHFLVNVFPDHSPHSYGRRLQQSMGIYDLVVSTKPFHPRQWRSTYGYDNACVCVPHGYDPAVHFWPASSSEFEHDVVLAASWRPEYHRLMLEFANAIRGEDIRVSLSGPGWSSRRQAFPANWSIEGPYFGRSYGSWLRRGKIAIAPVQTQVTVGGISQPGDEDTTRSYELAAAGCFFLHRRTPYIKTVYDEESEVPMWDDAQELARLVKFYLPREEQRINMARRTHERAVPAYSIPVRAKRLYEIIDHHRRLAGDDAKHGLRIE